MATLTKTISVGIRVSGPSPTSKWGAFLWGQKWGESGDGYFTVFKYVANSVALSSDMVSAQAEKWISAGSVVCSSRVNFGTLSDGSGWNYVFVSDVTDPDDRSFAQWTEESNSSSGFSEDSEPTTSWTEL